MRSTRVWIFLLWGLVVAGSSLAQEGEVQPSMEPVLVDVFVPGKDGYPAIRIPSIVAVGEVLLAFAEGRQGGDHSNNEIICKRSEDSGRTWGSVIPVYSAEGLACNNPQAVVVSEDLVILMFQLNKLGERAAKPGLGEDAYRNLVVTSSDQGKTWSEPVDVTESTKRLEVVTSIASGPGIGIVLSEKSPASGRIVMPMNQGPFGKWSVYAVFSDDLGKTWQMGDVAPNGEEPGFANEVQMVELSDGSIMLNARIQGGNGRHCRKISRSVDGGRTWSVLRDDPSLIDPVCQASILRFIPPSKNGQSGRKEIVPLLFMNPADESKRIRGGLRASLDDGRTWSSPVVVYPGGFAYSCLVQTAENKIGFLFERDNYSAITFGYFDMPVFDWQQ